MKKAKELFKELGFDWDETINIIRISKEFYCDLYFYKRDGIYDKNNIVLELQNLNRHYDFEIDESMLKAINALFEEYRKV